MNPTDAISSDQESATSHPHHRPPARPRFPFEILLLVWLLVVVTATLVTFVLPESFSSTARIKIERDQADITPLANPGAAVGYDPYFIQTEFELLQSELILDKVIDDLDLDQVWGKKYANGERLKTSESLSMLKGRMDLRPVRNTSLIEIRVFSERADEAAKLANAIAETYKAFRLEQLAKLRRGGIKALEEQLADQDAKVKKAQAEVDALRVKLNISDAKGAGEGLAPLMSSDSLRKLEAMRIQSQGEYVRQPALLNSLKSIEQGWGW
jgi:succinoglycan biosynthesis transport protein ExoP